MKKLVALLAAAFAGALTSPAATVAAATPVAVWDGDFSPDALTQFSGYELVDWNETHGENYSSVTIDRANQGLMFNATSPMSAITVLVRYSGLAVNSSTHRVVFSSCVSSSHQGLRTGVRLGKGTYYNGMTSGGDYGTAAGQSVSEGVMAFTYSPAAGTYFFDGATQSALASKWGSDSLKYKNDEIYGAGIGGFPDGASISGYEAAQGMTIYAVAVFDSVLTLDEMKSYVWPNDQTIDVESNTSVSAINARIDASANNVWINVADGVEIEVDAALSGAVPVFFKSEGSVTLAAASQPDASRLSALLAADFSRIKGGLLRSWLTSLVVGFNFNSYGARNYAGATEGVVDGSADVSCALVSGSWQSDAKSNSGSSTALFGDGLSTLAWKSANVYAVGENEANANLLNGYLDDGGTGAEITLSNVPYETYDVVIYAGTDSGTASFKAKTVNGTEYTCGSDGVGVSGSASWGGSGTSIPLYARNAMRINGLSGPLAVNGGINSGGRGGISAIQIMPTGTPDNIVTYTLALDGSSARWSTANWQSGGVSVAAPASGKVEITATASTTLTLDSAVSLNSFAFDGGNDVVLTAVADEGSSFFAGKVTVEGGVLQQGSASVFGATPSVIVEGGATFDLNGRAVNQATAFTIAGAGAGSWPWALTSSGGEFSGSIANVYLSDDATVGGSNKIVLGKDWSGSYGYLDGHTLTKTGEGELYLRNFNTPGSGTVLLSGGSIRTAQWNCFNAGSVGPTTLTIGQGTTLYANNLQANPPTVPILNWDGTLDTSARRFVVSSTLNGGGSTQNLNMGGGATANLTRDLTVSSAFTLAGAATFLKSSAASGDVTVSATGTLSAPGAITVGAGVTLDIGTNRPVGAITVAEGGTLAVRMQDAADIIQLSASAQPASVVLYDENGDEVSNPRIVFDDGTLFISPSKPTLRATGTVAFDTASNWEGSAMPSAGGEAVVELLGDAEITVAGSYSLGSLIVTGSGVVTFSGEGAIEAETISARNGATFVRGGNVSATTGIDLAAGTVLRIDGVDESAVISGAGAVETYGDVTMGGANTFTGGITAKTGILSTTVFNGFGGAKDDGSHSVTVEDGACVDISNTADTTHSLTIAGNGVLLPGGTYSGAVRKSTGSDYSINNRQTKSITLTADALVDVTTGWGIVRSSHNEATLSLNGHTLTIRGNQTTFPMAHVNASSSTGKIVLDGVTLQVGSQYASDFTGVEIVAKGGSAVNFELAPSAIGAVTVLPTATSGVGISGYANMGEVVPVVRTSDIDASALAAGDEITLLTADADLTAGENVATEASSRYAITVSGRTVTATAVSVLSNPFLHYCFDDGAAVDTGKAADSRTQIYAFGEAGSPTLFNSRNGSAVHVHTGYTAYWDTNVSGVSPFGVGEVSVTTVAKMKETGVVVWGLGNTNNNNPALGLVVLDETSASVVARNTSGTVETLVTLTGTADLTRGWHFFAVVATAYGTSLCVDGMSASSDKTVSFSIGQQGQFGSFHGGAIGAGKVGAEGYLLDDWRVYDAALTAEEIRVIRGNLAPEPLFLRLR